MTKKRKICVVTTSRAEYGLLFPVLKEIEKSSDFELALVVTGTHLDKRHGHTQDHITKDGFNIAASFAIDLSDNTALGASHASAQALEGFAKAFHELNPDLVFVPGDRYEVLPAAFAATLKLIPVAHIFGGDETLGAFDNAIRHAITKMAHIHFTTNDESKNRIIQMGENPQHVYSVGNPGLDHIHLTPLITDRDAFFNEINFTPRAKNFLVTYHPETFDLVAPKIRFAALTEALARFGEGVGLIYTFPNADPSSDEIRTELEKLAQAKPNVKIYPSLGFKLYLSALKHVDVVIGNSSSGILEVPSFKIPTVNIGERQKGRAAAGSVVNSGASADEIFAAVNKALQLDCSGTQNPYGDGHSAGRIVKALREIPDFKKLVKKSFMTLQPKSDV